MTSCTQYLIEFNTTNNSTFSAASQVYKVISLNPINWSDLPCKIGTL